MVAHTTPPMNHASTSIQSAPRATGAGANKAAALRGGARGSALRQATASSEVTAGPGPVRFTSFSVRLDRHLPCAPAALGHLTDIFPPTSLFRLL
jgi:hypothetical protein